jgi:hypothetical protein
VLVGRSVVDYALITEWLRRKVKNFSEAWKSLVICLLLLAGWNKELIVNPLQRKMLAHIVKYKWKKYSKLNVRYLNNNENKFFMYSLVFF